MQSGARGANIASMFQALYPEMTASAVVRSVDGCSGNIVLMLSPMDDFEWRKGVCIDNLYQVRGAMIESKREQKLSKSKARLETSGVYELSLEASFYI